jgi:hypothetical protein
MAQTENTGKLDSAGDAIENVAAAGRKALEEGLQEARDYGEKSLDYLAQVRGGLIDFVKREPLLAVGAAFLVGYVAAQMVKRLPS